MIPNPSTTSGVVIQLPDLASGGLSVIIKPQIHATKSLVPVEIPLVQRPHIDSLFSNNVLWLQPQPKCHKRPASSNH